MSRTPIQKTWRHRVDQGLGVLSEVADTVIQLGHKPTAIGVGLAAAKLLHTANRTIVKKPSEYFQGWQYLPSMYPLGDYMHAVCRLEGLLVEAYTAGGGDGDRAVTARLPNGVNVGWLETASWCDGPYIEPNTEERDALLGARQLLWQHTGCAARYVSPGIGFDRLVKDDPDETLPTKVAENIWEDARGHIENGRSWSVLLHGEPGTGKSNAIRYTAKIAGGRSGSLSLRLRARDLSRLRHLSAVIHILQPSAVLIDDIDRVADPEAVLEDLDEVLSSASLILATCNDPTRLTAAVLRRFSDYRQLSSLEPAILDYLLKGADDETREHLASLPVIWISRYHEHAQAYGHEAARLKVPEFVKRREQALAQLEEDKRRADNTDTKPSV